MSPIVLFLLLLSQAVRAATRSQLTHVFVPFAHPQWELIGTNVLQRWTEFRPCRPTEMQPQTDKPSLVLVLASCREDLRADIRNRSALALAEWGDVARCWHDVALWTLNLTEQEDTYLSASRLVFERLLLHAQLRDRSHHPEIEITSLSSSLTGKTGPLDGGTRPVDYAMYLEPDVLAVRDRWLAIMSREVRHAQYWVSGSINRGLAPHTLRPGYLYHINGNALYQMGSREFAAYYFDRVVPWTSAKFGALFAYDAAMGEYNYDAANYDTFRSMAHKFVFTDLIRNVYGLSWAAGDRIPHGTGTLEERTVFIHGGRFGNS